MAHAKDEPFGDRVEDIRAGIVAAAVYNTNVVAKPGVDVKLVDPLDFFAWHKKPPPPEPKIEPPEVLAARIRALLNSKANKDEKK